MGEEMGKGGDNQVGKLPFWKDVLKDGLIFSAFIMMAGGVYALLVWEMEPAQTLFLLAILCLLWSQVYASDG